ncbi:MAG: HAD family hydrolase [Oscillospiraceae bacterium]|nr:HAD family hydrolase [Oscillospiraceae bacterium]
MTPQKSHILFDLDGTITDPAVGITKSFNFALEAFDVHVADLSELHRVIGPPLRDSFRDFYGFDDDTAERAVAKYREYYADTGIYENTLYTDIAELLRELRGAGRTLIVATSKPTVYTRRILEHFGIAGCFVFVSGAELDGRRSAKSEIIGYALENVASLTAQNAVMIGDRHYDIEGAKSHGIASIGVLYGYGTERELVGAGADYIVADVSGLRDLLL